MKAHFVTLILVLAGCTDRPPLPKGAPSPTPANPSLPAYPPALTVAAAFEKLCDGPASIPLEVAGSRHFVGILLAGPKGKETVRFHVDTGGNTPGLMLAKSVGHRLGFLTENELPRAIRLGTREV